jgi:hypothetical protein
MTCAQQLSNAFAASVFIVADGPAMPLYACSNAPRVLCNETCTFTDRDALNCGACGERQQPILQTCDTLIPAAVFGLSHCTRVVCAERKRAGLCMAGIDDPVWQGLTDDREECVDCAIT